MSLRVPTPTGQIGSVAITLALIVIFSMALDRAIRRHTASRAARTMNTIAIFVLTLVAVLWIVTNPARADAHSALVAQITGAAYALLSIGVGFAQHVSSSAPEVRAQQPSHQIEHKRRLEIVAFCIVGMIGLVAAVTGSLIPAASATLAWWCQVSGWLLSTVATGGVIYTFRGTVVPEGRAVSQKGQCFKSGQRYLPLDDDRHIFLHERVLVVPLRTPETALVIKWRPDSEQLPTFVVNFSTDAAAESKLHELAQYCRGNDVVKHARTIGIEVRDKPQMTTNKPRVAAKRLQLPPV